MDRNVYAYTALDSPFPEYISINDRDGRTEVTVRSPPERLAAGTMAGFGATMTLPRGQLLELARALLVAYVWGRDGAGFNFDVWEPDPPLFSLATTPPGSTNALRWLLKEPPYEGGKKENGISVRFLARMTILSAAAGVDVPRALLEEARALFADTGR